MEEKHKILQTLADAAIDRLRKLPQPVVRVAGPLTSGRYSYKKNLARFLVVEQKLKNMGLNVFDYFLDNDDEDVIQSLQSPWEDIMEHYHDPILKTGLIQIGYFMPHWEESNGARVEREHFEKFNLEIRDVPEEWLQ